MKLYGGGPIIANGCNSSPTLCWALIVSAFITVRYTSYLGSGFLKPAKFTARWWSVGFSGVLVMTVVKRSFLEVSTAMGIVLEACDSWVSMSVALSPANFGGIGDFISLTLLTAIPISGA